MSTIPIIKITDLLLASTIQQQIAVAGRNEVSIAIAAAVSKCCAALDITLQNSVMQMLVEDIVDKYKYDSIEDVQQCLKKGRRGDYGPTYNKLNMIIITQWMSNHLQEKASVREQAAQNIKHSDKVTFEDWKRLFDSAPKQSNAQAIGKRTANEYKPSAQQLKMFQGIVKTFTSAELQKALKQWSTRQRPQHVQIIEKEINSRKSK